MIVGADLLAAVRGRAGVSDVLRPGYSGRSRARPASGVCVHPMSDLQTSIRIPKDFIKRADALARKLARTPRFVALGEMTRSKVLRLAIAIGIEQLEEEHGAQRRGRRS